MRCGRHAGCGGDGPSAAWRCRRAACTAGRGRPCTAGTRRRGVRRGGRCRRGRPRRSRARPGRAASRGLPARR
ncbi:MAG TPA: hypothetical protein DD420_31065 [Streptomyces sp.]|nr:hypothetical protein [Streptomyces sp.]